MEKNKIEEENMGKYVSILKELAQEGRESKIRNHKEKDVCTQVLKFLTIHIKTYTIYRYRALKTSNRL